MKKIVSMLTLVVCISLFSGCDFVDGFKEGYKSALKEKSTVTFDDYDYSVQMTPMWKKIENDNFDLKCQTNNEDQYALFWVFNDIDIAQDQTRASLFKDNMSKILEVRQNVELVDVISTRTIGDKTITTTLYSAERDSAKSYYYFNLVEIKDTDDFFWVLYTAIPSVANKNMEKWDKISESIAPVSKPA